jgi:hypothetical protein
MLRSFCRLQTDRFSALLQRPCQVNCEQLNGVSGLLARVSWETSKEGNRRRGNRACTARVYDFSMLARISRKMEKAFLSFRGFQDLPCDTLPLRACFPYGMYFHRGHPK